VDGLIELLLSAEEAAAGGIVTISVAAPELERLALAPDSGGAGTRRGGLGYLKEFRVLRTTYAPGAQNPKHYHPSHVVFYVLEGEGVWQEEGKEPVTLKPGDTLHVQPGMIHSHRNASTSEKLVFLEFVIVEKGQRSTVPMP